jgi:hypothetical protein
MTLKRNLVLSAVATALISTSALAAAKSGETMSPQEQTADHDFGKLSADGVKAFADVRLARLAIFDGKTAKAKALIDSAQAAIDKAKSDDTVFTKAEADLKPGPGMTQNDGGNAKPGTDQVAWIPVDGQMTLAEDYVATPEKAAGVEKANSQLKTGDKKHAMETLKLAGIDVNFVEQVAPLNSTISGVDNAAKLIGEGHYYEANQALKSVEDGTRFDSQILAAAPDKTPAHS